MTVLQDHEVDSYAYYYSQLHTDSHILSDYK